MAEIPTTDQLRLIRFQGMIWCEAENQFWWPRIISHSESDRFGRRCFLRREFGGVVRRRRIIQRLKQTAGNDAYPGRSGSLPFGWIESRTRLEPTLTQTHLPIPSADRAHFLSVLEDQV